MRSLNTRMIRTLCYWLSLSFLFQVCLLMLLCSRAQLIFQKYYLHIYKYKHQWSLLLSNEWTFLARNELSFWLSQSWIEDARAWAWTSVLRCCLVPGAPPVCSYNICRYLRFAPELVNAVAEPWLSTFLPHLCRQLLCVTTQRLQRPFWGNPQSPGTTCKMESSTQTFLWIWTWVTVS